MTDRTMTIFVSAYRNVSIRYILHSDIFSGLTDRKAQVVVFVRDNHIDYYRKLYRAENVVFEPVLYGPAMKTLRKSRIGRIFLSVRRCVSGHSGKMVNTTDDLYFSELRENLSSRAVDRARFLLIRVLVRLCRKAPFFRRTLVQVEAFFFPGRLYDRYFKVYRPQALVVSSIGYMIDPYFMRAAKRNGCKVISIIHNWDNPTTKDYRGVVPDDVVVWNENMKREVQVFHDIPEERIHVGGIAHWDAYFNGNVKPRPRSEFLKDHRMRNDRKVLFYGTSSYMIFRSTFDVVEQLARAVSSGGLICPCQLLVRLHPAYFVNSRKGQIRVIDRFCGRIAELEKKYEGLIRFFHPELILLEDDFDMPMSDMLHLIEAIRHSDVLLTEYSTLMIEAAILDVPIINVGLNHYRDTRQPITCIERMTHLKRILGYGAVRNAYSYSQLIAYINGYLSDRGLDRDRRRALVANEIPQNRGRAGKDIGDLLYRLAGRPASDPSMRSQRTSQVQ
jgi:hypothetical protein